MIDAQEQHERLMGVAALCDAGRIVLDVLELHAPYGESCGGCVGSIQGDAPTWPDDCTTTHAVAKGLGFDLEYRYPRTPPAPPPLPRPGTAYPVEGYGMDVLVHGEHAAPVIDAEQVAPDVARITVTVDFPGGREVLEAIVVTDAPREPGAVLAQRFTYGLSMSLRWAL